MRPYFLAALIPSLIGCAGVTPLAEEAPYAGMIGQCYVLQQDMRIRENVCWELGGLVVSPDESEHCFRGALSLAKKGTKLLISDVRRKRWGSAGFCPQIVVDIHGVSIPGEDVYLPLCYSREYMSWLEDALWQRGDELRLKSKYVVPCGVQ